MKLPDEQFCALRELQLKIQFIAMTGFLMACLGFGIMLGTFGALAL